jgi:DNA-binding SARP family transcriptional activator/Flp pilus assembly protein TadD
MDLTAALKGPKRLALLAYLAVVEPGQFHHRDTLLALFWPESSDQRARGSLRNTLHYLRKVLGHELLENNGADQIRIAPGALWCDAVAFRDAFEADRFTEAVELYRGDLLPGLFVSGAPGFEDWLSRERDRLNRAAATAAWTLADEAQKAGDPTAAAQHAHYAANLNTLDEQAIRRLIGLLDHLGDRAGALSVYKAFAERLRAEMLGEPAPETVDLVETIMSRRHLHQEASSLDPAGAELTPPDERATDLPESSIEDHTTTGTTASSQDPAPDLTISAPVPTSAVPHPQMEDRSQQGRRLWKNLGLVTAMILLGIFFGLRARGHRVSAKAPGHIALAIGEVETIGDGGEASAGAILPGLLSTNLARAPEIRVLSSAHLLDILNGYDDNVTISRAARDAGADELLQSTLIRKGDDLLRLDLRRIDLQTGEVRAAYSVEGRDPFALVDRATERLLDSFGLARPATGIAEVSTHSLIAYRLYEEGVRAYVEGDNRTAQRLLTAALAEDSAFAMAAYYRAESNRIIDHRAFRDDLYRAARLADNATDLERLRIRAAWAQAMDEPAQYLFADSLVQRFPNHPDGHLYFGKALLWGGEFHAALPYLQRAFELDSLSLYGTGASCVACSAIADIVVSYMLADSLPTAERMARRWTELQPGSAWAWHLLGSTLEYQNRTAEAQLARNSAAELRSDNPRDPLFPAVLALRSGDFERADRLIDELDGPSSSLVQQNVLWYRVLSLRCQGRLAEALPVARRYTAMLNEAAATGHSTAWPEVLEALVLAEMGRATESAALWEKMAGQIFDPESPARSARHRAWTLTHAATALASADDPDRLAELANEIEWLGSQSAYGRDPRLHHYVRGLLRSIDGDSTAAVAAFRRALFSTTDGYARINLELGRHLLALGKPDEAVEVLGAALRGPLDGGNLYVSRTEIHELTGYAWEAAGNPDSARVHYQWVVDAWKDADRSLAERRDEVQARLQRMTL